MKRDDFLDECFTPEPGRRFEACGKFSDPRRMLDALRKRLGSRTLDEIREWAKEAMWTSQ